MTGIIQPHPFAFPDAALNDLRERLSRTRWSDRETVNDWSQGAPLARMQALCDYWRDGYDWRACEARLNALNPSMTRIDGLDIHFLHLRSPEPNAVPLVMTHGWPGSVIEFLKVAPPTRKEKRKCFPIGKADSICTVCSASTTKRLITIAILMWSGQVRLT